MSSAGHGDGRVFVEYHHVLVVDLAAYPVPFDAGAPVAGGLVEELLGRRGLRIFTGIHTGPVAFTWHVLDQAPQQPDADVEVAKVSLQVGGQGVLVETLTGHEDQPVLPVPAGDWRVQVTYRDRHGQWDHNLEDLALERFDLTFWR